MQVFPPGWKSEGDAPCYLILGNWLNGADAEFIMSLNVTLVLRAAGQQTDGSPAKPGRYPVNPWTGHPPETVDCPVNNLNQVSSKWKLICEKCIRTWKLSSSWQPPNTVLVHCNEGINRGPALASIIAGKLMDRTPGIMAEILSRHRDINPMYSEGTRRASRMGRRGWGW